MAIYTLSLTGPDTIITASSYPITSSWSSNAVIATSADLSTQANTAVTASYALTSLSSSWAPQLPNIQFPTPTSCSWASSSFSASYINPNQNYSVISINTNSIVINFGTPNQRVNLNTAQQYVFSGIRFPATGQISDVFLYVSHSATTPSTLVFPSNWINLQNSWPSSLPAKTISTFWFRAIDSIVVGTSNIQGTIQTGSVSNSTTSSYAIHAATSSCVIQSNVSIVNGNLYLMDNFGVGWRVNVISPSSGSGTATITLSNP